MLSLVASAPAFAGPLYVNILTNGNFDTAPGGSTVSTEFGSSTYAALSGWTVTAGTAPGGGKSTPFDIWWNQATATTTGAATQYGSYNQDFFAVPPPDNGNAHFVSLDGDPYATGVLSQSLTGLVVGDHYQLSFDWATGQLRTTQQNAGYTIGVAFNLGTAALTSSTYTSAPSTGTLSEAYKATTPWMTVTYNFTATSTSEILSFLAFGGPIGEPPTALLDDVSLEDIPEPSSLALVAGAALVGSLALRRRGQRKAS